MPFNYPTLSPYKPGDNYSIVGAVRLPAGTWIGTCTMRGRDDGVLIGTWAVALGTPDDGLTPMTLTPIGDTAGWRIGTALIDVRFTDDTGAEVHTPTVALPISTPITRDTP